MKVLKSMKVTLNRIFCLYSMKQNQNNQQMLSLKQKNIARYEKIEISTKRYKQVSILRRQSYQMRGWPYLKKDPEEGEKFESFKLASNELLTIP